MYAPIAQLVVRRSLKTKVVGSRPTWGIMKKANNKVVVTLGDWSDDGHGKYDKIELYISCTVKEMQEAYKASCKKTGISFNINEDYTERNKYPAYGQAYQVCTDYEQNSISNEVRKTLTKFDCPWDTFEIDGMDDISESDYENEEYNDKNGYLDNHSFIKLLMWFISLSIENFEWRFPSKGEQPEYFNGWWDDNLNIQLGYGLY